MNASRPTTWCPSAISASHMCDPINPAAPVTRARNLVPFVRCLRAFAVSQPRQREEGQRCSPVYTHVESVQVLEEVVYREGGEYTDGTDYHRLAVRVAEGPDPPERAETHYKGRYQHYHITEESDNAHFGEQVE